MHNEELTDEILHGTRTLVVASMMALLLFGVIATLTILGDSTDEVAATRPRLASVLSQAEPEVGEDAGGIGTFSGGAGGFSAGIETFEVFGGRNPFERPISFETGTTGPDGSTTTMPGDTTTTGGGTTQTTSLDPTQRRTVDLKEIYVDGSGTVANIQVDGVLYSGVGVDDVFAVTFKVKGLSLGDGCGDFLNGDVAFQLCVGESILK